MIPVNVFAPTFDECDSYGRIASRLSAGIERLGGWVNRYGDQAPKGMVQLVTGGFVLGYPSNGDAYPLAQAGPRVALTTFETTQVPADWPDKLNGYEAVIVPSVFAKDVFEACGVTVPIHVIPQGVNEAFMSPRQRSWDPDGDEPFTVLIFADRGRRKAWWEATLAFSMAFEDDPDYRLIVKTRHPGFNLLNENIEVVNGDLNEAEMRDLYDRSHVMLFPGREGYGLPPREFAGTGGVAMALNWGGTVDGLLEWGVPILHSGMETAFPDKPAFFGTTGEWAKVDSLVMATLLQVVRDNYPYFAAQALRGARYVREHYQWQDYAARCWRVYRDVLEAHRARNSA